MQFIAYAIRRRDSGKTYIGITTKPLSHRWGKHLGAAIAGRSTRIADAIRKHGTDAFTVEHIASASALVDLQVLEILLIAQENSYLRGYNATTGGEGVPGYNPSAATRHKLSEAAKGRKPNRETIEKRAAKLRGRKGYSPSAEQRQRSSDARKGRDVLSPEARKRQAATLRGRVFTAEWKAKISAAKKGTNSWTPEQRAAHSAKMSGRKMHPRSEAHRANLAKQWTPERRAEIGHKLAAARWDR